MNRLGELERAIMDVLWETPEPLTVRQVSGQLTERDLAHTTVMTVLDRLAKKGFARRERDGRAWRYRAAESQGSVRHRADAERARPDRRPAGGAGPVRPQRVRRGGAGAAPGARGARPGRRDGARLRPAWPTATAGRTPHEAARSTRADRPCSPPSSSSPRSRRASLPAASALASARWPGRSPAAAIVLWQALGLGWGLAAVGRAGRARRGPGHAGALPGGVAGAALAVASRVMPRRARSGRGLLARSRPAAGIRGRRAGAVRCCSAGCWWRPPPRCCGPGGGSGCCSACWPTATPRCRARWWLITRRRPPTACPALRSRIVISAGTLDLLDQAELAAVLAHERAHLRERHDLVLLPFTALLRAFRWSRGGPRGRRARSRCWSRCWPTTGRCGTGRPGNSPPRCCGWARRGRGCRPARALAAADPGGDGEVAVAGVPAAAAGARAAGRGRGPGRRSRRSCWWPSPSPFLSFPF